MNRRIRAGEYEWLALQVILDDQMTLYDTVFNGY